MFVARFLLQIVLGAGVAESLVFAADGSDVFEAASNFVRLHGLTQVQKPVAQPPRYHVCAVLRQEITRRNIVPWSRERGVRAPTRLRSAWQALWRGPLSQRWGSRLPRQHMALAIERLLALAAGDFSLGRLACAAVGLSLTAHLWCTVGGLAAFAP